MINKKTADFSAVLIFLKNIKKKLCKVRLYGLEMRFLSNICLDKYKKPAIIVAVKNICSNKM